MTASSFSINWLTTRTPGFSRFVLLNTTVNPAIHGDQYLAGVHNFSYHLHVYATADSHPASSSSVLTLHAVEFLPDIFDSHWARKCSRDPSSTCRRFNLPRPWPLESTKALVQSSLWRLSIMEIRGRPRFCSGTCFKKDSKDVFVVTLFAIAAVENKLTMFPGSRSLTSSS